MNRLLLRWLVPLIGGVLALAILFLLYRNLDFSRFMTEISQARPGWIMLLVVTILLEFLIHGWKWRQLLYDLKPVSSLRLAAALLAGYGSNVLVPLGIGPLVRAWLVARREQLRMATVLATTVIARFVDGIVFAFFACLVAISGQVPAIEGDLQTVLFLAGLLNLALFSGILWLLFRSQPSLSRDDTRISRAIDWVVSKGPSAFERLRDTFSCGIVWPAQRARQLAVVLASFAVKLVATTNFIWAGLAVGVTLGFFDYLLVMVIAGFALVLTRLVRVPGGFAIGVAFALNLLGVPDEQALAMILFSHMIATILVVSLGLVILWQSGIDIRRAAQGLDLSEQA